METRRLRASDVFLSVGLLLGASIAIVGLAIAGGGLRWFIHSPTSQLGLPLALALIGTGATWRRVEQVSRRDLDALAELRRRNEVVEDYR